MRCLTGVKYNHMVTVIDYAPRANALDDAIEGGTWEVVQDPDTGAISRVWVETTAVATGADVDLKQVIQRDDIPCYARGFTELGFRSTANTQRFDRGDYEAVEVIQITYPAKYSIARNQYITNIRDRYNNVLWMEEELGQPTIFEVQGVTPVFDPFGVHKDNIAVLRRAANQ